MTTPVLPGQWIGILGGGQLGRMAAMAAKAMGYFVHIYTPEANSPAAQVSDKTTVAAFEDDTALKAFAQAVDVITLEFENIPARAVELLQERVPVRPGLPALYVTQHRLREKSFLRDNGFPVTPFAPVTSPEDLLDALELFGYPAILKTAGFGYDGKGQSMLRTEADALSAFEALAGQAAILEQFVDFETEFSIVAARGLDGSFAHYGVIENRHKHHILDVSLSPAPALAHVEPQAVNIARGVLEALQVVGIMCIEFFLTRDGRAIINELAPRPHNSGHLTIEGFATSQFEQQVRAVCGLPLGSTQRLTGGGAMANLLGDIWSSGEPDWTALLANPTVKLHLYGKSEPRPGRKMGHITALADTPEEAASHAIAARDALHHATTQPLP